MTSWTMTPRWCWPPFRMPTSRARRSGDRRRRYGRTVLRGCLSRGRRDGDESRRVRAAVSRRSLPTWRRYAGRPSTPWKSPPAWRPGGSATRWWSIPMPCRTSSPLPMCCTEAHRSAQSPTRRVWNHPAVRPAQDRVIVLVVVVNRQPRHEDRIGRPVVRQRIERRSRLTSHVPSTAPSRPRVTSRAGSRPRALSR